MKKTFIYIALYLLTAVTAVAQAPQAFNYQGVARTTAGVPLANTTLGLRLTVHDGSASGAIVYQETQTPATNSFGLYNIGLGNGTPVTGTVNTVIWATGNKFLQVEIDPAGGTAYSDAGTSQLLSVPYAIFADNAGGAKTLNGTVPMAGDVTGTNAAASVVKLNGNAISATAPASGQVLTWNSGSSTWGPATPATWGSVTSITAGSGLSGGTITTSGTISMSTVGTAGTYGSATQVPVITTDAQGRVSSVTNTTITGDDWGSQVVHADATLTGNGTIATPLKIAQQSAATGQILEWSGSSWMPASIPAYSAGTGLSLAGATFNAQTTNALWNANELQGNNISATAPTSGQGLLWSGTAWTPTTLPSTTYTSGTGINVAGSVINAQTTTALWNANELQGKDISATAPTSGQVLTYNSGTSAWTPTTPATGGSVTSITAGTGLSGGTISTAGTISMPNVGTAGTYGSATQVPVFTTDAQGRITGVTLATITAGASYSAGTGLSLVGTTFSMPNTGTSGTYGSSTQVPIFTTDAQGRVIAVTNATISGTAPGGTAGGDLTGSYPNPSVAAGAITDAKVSATAAIAYSKLSLTGAIKIADHSATGTPSATTFYRGDNTWSTPTGIVPGGAAGGDLAGTYPNPTLATTGVTAATYGSATTSPTITVDAKGRITSASSTTITGTTPGGAASGDLTGTYPGPALATSGVTAGTYGTATQSPTIVVDAKGRITSASNTTITTGVAGTTNYIPVFTSATTIANSIIYQNPASGNRIGINNGTSNHGLVAIKATADTIALYINQSGTPGVGGYGIERHEYTGPNDNTRVGILSTTIKSISDVNGTGIEGAGNGIGVEGLAEASTASQVEGLEGDSYGSGSYSVGVGGFASNYIGAPTNAYGVYGYASGGTTNYAVYSDGNARINGSISKASGTFEIDHPLDPANKYLYHSFVESPDMMNIYNGNVVTDANGDATITLPSYFDALNKDFRYQLTTIRSFAQAMVAEEISGNSFKIKTSQPNVKVSWMVTGVRQDAWANAHRVVPEVDKGEADKGKYLHPKEMGQPDSLRIGGDIKPHGKKNDPALISKNNVPQK